MTTDPDDREPVHTASPTARILDQLQLHGYHPRPGEPDMRPLPEDEAIDGAIADIFDALTGTLADTRLDADLDTLLWSTVNSFHRAADFQRGQCFVRTQDFIPFTLEVFRA